MNVCWGSHIEISVPGLGTYCSGCGIAFLFLGGEVYKTGCGIHQWSKSKCLFHGFHMFGLEVRPRRVPPGIRTWCVWRIGHKTILLMPWPTDRCSKFIQFLETHTVLLGSPWRAGKDLAKMNKEQSNAAIFFREMVHYMKLLDADTRAFGQLLVDVIYQHPMILSTALKHKFLLIVISWWLSLGKKISRTDGGWALKRAAVWDDCPVNFVNAHWETIIMTENPWKFTLDSKTLVCRAAWRPFSGCLFLFWSVYEWPGQVGGFHFRWMQPARTLGFDQRRVSEVQRL